MNLFTVSFERRNKPSSLLSKNEPVNVNEESENRSFNDEYTCV
jgi:hypothetical protein